MTIAPSATSLPLPDGTAAPLVVRINPRARRILMRVDPVARSAVLVVPTKRSLPAGIRFAHSHGAWVQKRLATLPTGKPFEDGVVIPVRGVETRIVWEEAALARPILEGNVLRVGGSPHLVQARVRRFLQGLAREDLSKAVMRFAEHLGVTPGKISLKDARGRWGSCSSKGGLNFSWRLIAAPPAVLDYVAAHEVAHLREMNHGPAFWALVHHLYGDHRQARAWLAAHGPGLHALGS